MSPFTQSHSFSRNWKARNEKRLRHLANMRAAKERKRLANPPEREPKMERYYPMALTITNKRTGESASWDLKSVRDAAKRIGVVLKFYRP